MSNVTLPQELCLQAKRPHIDSGISMPMSSLPRIITHLRVAVLHGRKIDQLDVFVAFIIKQQASNQVQEVTLYTSSPNPFQLLWIPWILWIRQSGSSIKVALIILPQCLITNVTTILFIAIFHCLRLRHT